MSIFHLNESFKIHFSFSKKLTKIEREFIVFFMNFLEKNSNKVFTVPYTEFLTFFKGSREGIFEILQGIKKKSFFYKTISNNFQINGCFSIFSSFYFLKDRVTINFSQEFISFFDYNSFFHLSSSRGFLLFKEKFSLIFFLHIFNEDTRTKYFSIDEFKFFIETGGDYDRFYDFERFILKKLVADIESYTNFKLNYEKIKGGNELNSKIVGLNFCLEEKKNILDQDFLNICVKKYSSKISDFKSFILVLEELLKTYSKIEINKILCLAEVSDSKLDFTSKVLQYSKVECTSTKNLIRKNRIYSHNFLKVQSFILKELNFYDIPYNIIESFFPHPILADILKVEIGEKKIYEKDNFQFVLSKDTSFISFSGYISLKNI